MVYYASMLGGVALIYYGLWASVSIMTCLHPPPPASGTKVLGNTISIVICVGCFVAGFGYINFAETIATGASRYLEVMLGDTLSDRLYTAAMKGDVDLIQHDNSWHRNFYSSLVIILLVMCPVASGVGLAWQVQRERSTCPNPQTGMAQGLTQILSTLQVPFWCVVMLALIPIVRSMKNAWSVRKRSYEH